MKQMLRGMFKKVGEALAVTSEVQVANAGRGDRAEPFLLIVGRPLTVESVSPQGRFGTVFEDDGVTAYLYALDFAQKAQPIQEALHVYDVDAVADRNLRSAGEIRWSGDGLKASLWINDYPHVVVDFGAKRGYSRNNFPPPRNWTSRDFSWDDDVLREFEKA